MNVCLVQPLYRTDNLHLEELLDWEIKNLGKCDSSMDLIVLPEDAVVPGNIDLERKQAELLEQCAATAKRCRAIVCVNTKYKTDLGFRNTTLLFDQTGNIAGKYFKQHLTPAETTYLDSSYTYKSGPVTTVTAYGLRFAFLTCYDFYFYECISCIAKEKPDRIIGCSLQRTDTHTAIKMMTQYWAYNTNAYVVRASVSLGPDSPVGGCSMVVAPDASVLLDMKNHVGIETVEIDPSKKYFKPAGFNNPPCSHFEYVELGRQHYKNQ